VSNEENVNEVHASRMLSSNTQGRPQACSTCSASDNFTGGGVLNPKKNPYKLTCQFERFWSLDYGANTDINNVE